MSQLIKKEDKYFKECNVVMLPTEGRSVIVINNHFDLPPLQYRPDLTDASDIIRTAITYQHLYITSDDEVKEGDWVIEQTGLGYLQPYRLGSIRSEEYINRCKKIIATTDKSLKYSFTGYTETRSRTFYKELPQPSHKFIKAFCEQGGIDKVLLEYEMFNEPVNKNEILAGYIHSFELKTDSHNTITIKPVKDSWTREEVETLLFEYADNHALLSSNSEIKAFNKWIKENL